MRIWEIGRAAARISIEWVSFLRIERHKSHEVERARLVNRTVKRVPHLQQLQDIYRCVDFHGVLQMAPHF